MDSNELLSLNGGMDRPEATEDQRVVDEFEAAKAHSDISWLADEEMAAFLERLMDRTHRHA